MAEFTSFDAVEPVVEPAKDEVTYSKYWLQTLIIRAPDPKQDARASAVFKLYNPTTREFAPGVGQVNVDINGVFAEAATNATLAQAMELVFQALKAKLDLKLAGEETEGEI
ncbi:MAG: hypothetical protein KKD01_20215 [Proteobacteria bacterium]|nr:hypothetical protein [Pseudomonadota bacterium]